MRFYRPSKTSRVIFGAICVVMIGGCLLAICDSLIPGLLSSSEAGGRWLGLIFAVPLLLIFATALVEVFRGRIGISEDRFFVQRAFTTRSLPFADVRGYRTAKNGSLRIEGKTRRQRITISQFLEHSTDLNAWVARNFTDLDEQELAAQHLDLLENPAFGLGPEEREQNLARARKLATFVNIYGALAAFWLITEREWVTSAYILAILAPLAALGSLALNRGMLRISQDEESPHPNIFICLLVAPVAIFFRSRFDFHILDYGPAWKWTAVLALVLLTFLFATGTRVAWVGRSRIANIVIAALLLVLYSFSTVAAVNGIFDRSEPKRIDTRVLAKDVSTDRIKTYSLSLAPWNGDTEPVRIPVRQQVFQQTPVEAAVRVTCRRGLLDIPWCHLATE